MNVDQQSQLVPLRGLHEWTEPFWSRLNDSPPAGFHDARHAFDILRDFRFGRRARLSRPINGVRHLKRGADVRDVDSVHLSFSRDGRTTYARGLFDATLSDFVNADPTRDFSRRRGQPNKPVAHFTHTVGDLVPCESRLERELLLLADFDPRIIHVSSQPFTMEFPTGSRLRRYTPDFAIIANSPVPIAVEVKTPAKAADPETVADGVYIADTLADAGIGYVVWTGLPELVVDNLAHFSKTRLDATTAAAYEDALVGAAVGSARVRDIATSASDQRLDRGTALAAIRYFLWRHVLETDLHARYTLDSLVWPR